MLLLTELPLRLPDVDLLPVEAWLREAVACCPREPEDCERDTCCVREPSV